MSPIDKSDKLRKDIINGFLEKLPGISEDVLEKLYRYLEQYANSGGYFVNEKASATRLLGAAEAVRKALDDSGYFKATDIYIGDLSKITQNTIDLQSAVNKIDITSLSMSAIEKQYVSNVTAIMKTGGFNVNFIDPIVTALNEAITFGYSIQTTRDTLKDFVAGGQDKSGKLQGYLTVTARDTVSHLQGAQHQAILTELKMPYIRYVGSILKDSSGQCVRWRDIAYIEVKELQNEIDLAKKNNDAKLELPKGHKWSGFDKTTTPENFCVKRGHKGCIHQAFPVLKKY